MTEVYRLRDQPPPRQWPVWPGRIPETEEEIQHAIAWLKAQGFLQGSTSTTSSTSTAPPSSVPRMPAPPPPPEIVLRPPPVSPPPPVIPANRQIKYKASHESSGIWFVLGFVLLFAPVLLALVVHGIFASGSSSQPVYNTQPQPQLRPAVTERPAIALRGVLAGSSGVGQHHVSPTALATTRYTWHNVAPYGDLELHILGQLPSTADLPAHGAIGDAYLVGEHYWVWAQPAWAAIPTWCDP